VFFFRGFLLDEACKTVVAFSPAAVDTTFVFRAVEPDPLFLTVALAVALGCGAPLGATSRPPTTALKACWPVALPIFSGAFGAPPRPRFGFALAEIGVICVCGLAAEDGVVRQIFHPLQSEPVRIAE
jgi:hypothetical protein